MNSFELLVHQRALNEIRHLASAMEKRLPRIQRLLHLPRWWRDKIGGSLSTARAAYPVLTAPELARRSGIAAHAVHQSLVQLPHESKRRRQSLQALDAILQR